MRILHTSDWHLGRNFHGVQLLDAQLATLGCLTDVVRSEGVDVVVIAGDIYDRAVPSADAVQALTHLLCEIRNAGARIVGISGNHDSADRIGFAEPIMAAGGVSLRGDIQSIGTPVLIPDTSEDFAVAFYPIPYLEVERSRHALGEPEARTHDRLLNVALERARTDITRHSNIRTIAIVHAFVTGGEGSDSELALSVGGSAEVGLRAFKDFDYTALGHLHGRQKLGDGFTRYSGSPLPYSFSERNHIKGGWIIDLPKQGDPVVQPFDFPVQRKLFQLRGELQTLLQTTEFAEAEDGFVQAVLTDPLLPLEAMSKLQRRFPHAVHLMHEPPTTLDITRHSYSDRVKGRSDLELTVDFVQHIAGRPADAYEIEELVGAIDPSVPSQEVTEIAVA